MDAVNVFPNWAPEGTVGLCYLLMLGCCSSVPAKWIHVWPAILFPHQEAALSSACNSEPNCPFLNKVTAKVPDSTQKSHPFSLYQTTVNNCHTRTISLVMAHAHTRFIKKKHAVSLQDSWHVQICFLVS